MVLGLRLLICIFFINIVAATAQKSNFSTICFWDGFSRWRRRPYNSVVSDIPAEPCSAVVYSHVTVDDKNGWIRLTDKELELDPEAKSNANSWMYNPIWLLPPNKLFAQMRNLRRRNSKLKLLLAVGGPHEPVEKYWQLFSKPHLWKDMADSLAKWLKTYEFDGVVLDFFSGAGSLHESFRNWDNAKFIHPFLKLINHGLKDNKKGWSITFTLPAFDSTTHHLFDVEKLAEEVDYLLVKTSDCLEFPKGALLNVASTMDMTDIDRAEFIALKGVPRKKIVLEIPLSGRTYTAVSAPSGDHTAYPGHSGPYTKLQGFLAFFEVCSHIKSGWRRERFGEEACSFLKLGDEYVAYEDDESIIRKARMVMGRQYHGAAVRSVDLGDYKGDCKEKSFLLKALRSTLDITEYYVHFYFNPPNTTWWKEIEEKHATTELPSGSTFSAEPNTTPLQTNSETQGEPENRPTIENSRWHTPFVPHIPAEADELSTTPIASSSSSEDLAPRKLPEAHSTPKQAAPTAVKPKAATDQGTMPRRNAWNILVQKLFSPSVTTPSSPTMTSAPQTPKREAMELQNTPEVQGPPTQTASPTAQPTTATDMSPGPQNSAWNIIGSIFQKLFSQSITSPAPPTISTSSAPAVPKGPAMISQNTPEVQSTPIQAASPTEQATVATDKSAGPQNSAWNLIGSVFQKLFPPSVTKPSSPTMTSVPPTPKSEMTEPRNTREIQGPLSQTTSPTAQPTTATDMSPGPQNTPWNIIGSIFQKLFPQSVTSPDPPTTSTSSAPAAPKGQAMISQNTPKVHSTPIQAAPPTEQATAVTYKSAGPQNSAWNLIGSVFQGLFPPTVTKPSSPTMTSALPTSKSEVTEPQNTREIQGPPMQTTLLTAPPTMATDKIPGPSNSAWNIIGSIFQKIFPQSATSHAPPTTSTSSATAMPKGPAIISQNTPEVQSTTIQAALPTEQATAAIDKSSGPQNSAWNLIGSIFQELFPPSVTSPISPTTSSAPQIHKRETTKSLNTPNVQITFTEAVSPTAQPTAVTYKTTDPQHSAWNLIGSIFQELFPQSVTSPTLVTTSSALIAPTDEMSHAPPETIRDSSITETEASSEQPMRISVLTATAEASPVQPTTSSDLPTAKRETSPAPLTTLSAPMTKVKTPSAQPMTPSVPTSTSQALSVQPSTSSDPPAAKSETSPAPLTTLSAPMTKVKTSSAQPMTPSVLTTTAEASSVQPTTTSDPPTAKGETSPAPHTTPSTSTMTKTKSSSAQPMTSSVSTTVAEAPSAQSTMSSEYPMSKVTTLSTQRTTSLKSVTFKVVTSSPLPASPTALAGPPTPATVAKTNEGNVCKSTEDNKLLPHDSDCTKYYQCSHSRPFLQNCPQSTIFDIQRQVCNWRALANRPECI